MPSLQTATAAAQATAATSSPAATPSLSPGVHFAFDPAHNVGDVLALVNLLLQSLSFGLLLWAAIVVIRQLMNNKSTFWKASLVGVVLLLPLPLFEISFTLSLISQTTLWAFSPLCTLMADVLLRVGFFIVTVCRFHRVRIIAPLRRAKATKIFYAASATVALFMVINLYSNAGLRLCEVSHGLAGVLETTYLPDILSWIALDNVLTFVTFTVVTLANIITDALFIKILVGCAIQARQGQQSNMSDVRSFFQQEEVTLLMPYVPTLVVALGYTICLVASFVAPSIPNIIFFTIALNRFTPAVQTFIFYTVTVGQTRTIMAKMNSHFSTGSHGTKSAPFSSARGNATTTNNNGMLSHTGAAQSQFIELQYKPQSNSSNGARKQPTNHHSDDSALSSSPPANQQYYAAGNNYQPWHAAPPPAPAPAAIPLDNGLYPSMHAAQNNGPAPPRNVSRSPPSSRRQQGGNGHF